MHYLTAYPNAPAARDRFIVDLRGPRPPHDPWRFHDLAIDDEPTERGDVARVGTVFLTGRECPWRCAMCDLWRHTIHDDTPAGAIPAQIDAARRAWRGRGDHISRLKLYNASNFFDPRAVPESDYGAIGAQLADLEQVIVESHPSLVGTRVDRFLDAIAGTRLEVAMGLETAHPAALDALNKRMTIDNFARAAAELRRRDISVRVFLLIGPPFVPAAEQDEWLLRSIDAAFASGAAVVSLVPTRTGNGALDALAGAGMFQQPSLEDIERGLNLAHAQRRGRGRILVDLWDLDRFSQCAHCQASRGARLHAMNLEQRTPPPVVCTRCQRGQA